MVSVTGRAVLAPLSSNAMSFEETQQPSYHVTAAAVGHDGATTKLDSNLGESLGSTASARDWTRQQKRMNSREEAKSSTSLARLVTGDGGEHSDSARHGLIPILPVPSLPRTSRTPSAHRIESPGPVHVDENHRLHSSSPREGSEQEPSFPTPPDSGPEIQGKVTPAPVGSPSKRRRPISHYSPKKLSTEKPTSSRPDLVRTVSNASDEPSKRSKVTTPRKGRVHGRKHVSQDSFGEAAEPTKIAPLKRFEGIFRDATNEEEDSEHDAQKATSDVASLLSKHDDRTVEGDEAVQQTAPEPSDSSGHHHMQGHEIVIQGTSQQSSSPSRQPNVITTTPTLLTSGPRQSSPAAQPRFTTFPASNTTSSSQAPSRLFSSQAEGYGDTPSSPYMVHFSATQAVTQLHAHVAPIIPHSASPVPPRDPSTSVSTSGPSVPPHRRLGRTVPRRESPVSGTRTTATDAMRPSPGAKKISGIPPRPDTRNERKAEQEITEALGEDHFSSSIIDAGGLQDTFVNDLPLPPQPASSQLVLGPPLTSTPTGAPFHPTSSPHPDIRGMEYRSNGRLQRETPPNGSPPDGAALTSRIEATFVDGSTLPTQPKIRPIVIRYSTKRRPLEGKDEQSNGGRSHSENTPTPANLTVGEDQVPDVYHAKGKRKARPPSPAAETDSSPAPEDPEDNTYRPASKVSKRSKGKEPTRGGPTKQQKAKSGRPSVARAPSSRESNHRLPLIPDTTSLTTPLIAKPSGLHVFGWWGPEKAYYPGIVTRSEGDKYRVDFLDLSYATVPIERLRLCRLQAGDLIKPTDSISGREYKEVEVEKDWAGPDTPIKVRHQGASIGSVELQDILIRQAVINRAFGDRVVPAELLNTIPPPSSSRRTTSPAKKQPSTNTFSGMVFLVTSSSSGSLQNDSDAMRDKIRKHGGRVENDWKSLFALPASGFGSGLRSSDTPFLIAQGDLIVMKAKLMAALAKGIPCLAPEYINAAISGNADWRGYLVAAGHSAQMAQASSQWIDREWGTDQWDPSTAERLIKPFSGKTIFFIEPKSDEKKYDDVRALVPFSVHALGATTLDKVNSPDGVDEDRYDLIIVEDRDRTQRIPTSLKTSAKLCNVSWLKQCIIMSAALPPKLHNNK